MAETDAPTRGWIWLPQGPGAPGVRVGVRAADVVAVSGDERCKGASTNVLTRGGASWWTTLAPAAVLAAIAAAEGGQAAGV